MNNANPTRTICYKFRFDKGGVHDFVIRLDGKTLDILQDAKGPYPEWTRLSYQKCSNCPLDEKEHTHCPIAKKLVGTIDFFCKPMESKSVDLRVETPERVLSKKAGLKSAAVPLIGIYMATGDCPIMDKLRPMVRHHLPLATTPETAYRSIASYLIAQYLLARQGKDPDWELKKLGEIYDAIKIVNTCFRERLLKISSQDCALNAILTLDAYAYYINLSLIGETFYTIERLFDEDLQVRSISFDVPDEGTLPDNINTYQYLFAFKNNHTKEFTFHVDNETLRLANPERSSLPPWAKLECQKCPNCPLDGVRHEFCPAAASIAKAVGSLSETLSVDKADVTVRTPERDFSKFTTVAEGLSSLMDLVMPFSGCPVFGRLKPLAQNHLPFETPEEKIYRSLGMYLLYQKFSEKNKADPDWDLKGFSVFFKEINIANKAFRSRLSEIALDEESNNILAGMDCFTKYINFDISEQDIEELQLLFQKSYR